MAEEQNQGSPKAPKKRASNKLTDRLALFEQAAQKQKESANPSSPKKVPISSNKLKSNINNNNNDKNNNNNNVSELNKINDLKPLSETIVNENNKNENQNDKNNNNSNENPSVISSNKPVSGGIAARLAQISQSMNSSNTDNNNNNNNDTKRPSGGLKLSGALNIPMGGLKGGLPPSLLKKKQEQEQQKLANGESSPLPVNNKFDRPIIKTKRRPKSHHDLTQTEVNDGLKKYLKEHFEYDNGMIIAQRFLLQHLYECAGIDLHKHMDINDLINNITSNHNSPTIHKKVSSDEMIKIQKDEEDSKMIENQTWDMNKLDEIIIELFGVQAKHKWGYQIRVTN